MVVFAVAETYAGFIDVGFLHACGSAKLEKKKDGVKLQASEIVDWLRTPATFGIAGTFLRAYWYDGAYDPKHAAYENQRRFFNAIADTPGIQLRLGHIAEHPSKLETPIKLALANTASSVNVNPDDLIREFDRRWTFRPERTQKGVDTLIALDMVRLAGRSVFSTAVLIAGDRDLAEVVRTTQDFGVRTIVATPDPSFVAQELAQLADELITIPECVIERMMPDRS